MNTTYNTTAELLPAELVTGETEIQFIPSPQRVELELTLARLTEANVNKKGCDYPADLVDILTYGKNEALKQGQTYVNKYGHRGFSWGTKLGRFRCTKNAEENKLYVSFMTWAEVKEASRKF